MNKPLLSVLMPCHNKVRTVVEAVTSVLESGYPNLQIVFLNDVSTDGSLDALRAALDPWPSCIKVIDLAERSGKGKGHGGEVRDICLRAADGIYVTNLDCDDVLVSGAFDPQIEWLENNPEYGWCHAPVLNFDGREEFLNRKITDTPCLGLFDMSIPGWIAGRVKRWDINENWELMPNQTGLVPKNLFEIEWEYSFIQRSGCVYRKSVVLEVGGYDRELPERGSMQDYDLVLRLAHATPGHWVSKVTTKVRKDEKGSNDRWGVHPTIEAAVYGVYDRNRSYIQEKYRNWIDRKVEPIPFYNKKLGRCLSMCADGFANNFWPGMLVEHYRYDLTFEPVYDVIYSSWWWQTAIMSKVEIIEYWRTMLRIDGLLKVIVPNTEKAIGEVLLGLKSGGFEIRETNQTPFKMGSFEVEAIKRCQ